MTGLHVLDVGHGSCVAIIEGEEAVLIDAGPRDAVLRFLQESQVKRIRAVYISHADEDHLRGLLALTSEKVPIGELWLNSDGEKASLLWNDVLETFNQLHRTGESRFEPRLVEGDVFTAPCGISLQVLAPSRYLAGMGPGGRDSQNRKIETNTMSAVIRVMNAQGNALVLVPGDLDVVGLDHLHQADLDASAEVLVFPHHGGHAARHASDEANHDFAQRICQLVRPKSVVFSMSRNDGNPRQEIVRSIRASVPEVRILCTQLARACASRAPDHEPSHLTQLYAQGKRKHECCGGTITIDIAGAGLSPSRTAHDAFIGEVATEALCRRA